MIDPDVLRQLAADLDAKIDVIYADAVRLTDQGDTAEGRYCDGRGDAYFDVAVRIRGILADETLEGKDHG